MFLLWVIGFLSRTFDFIFRPKKWEADSIKIKEENKKQKEKRHRQWQDEFNKRKNIRCPNCSSSNVAPISCFSEQYKYKSYRCGNCGYRW